jgi:hypothetical protein
MPMFSELPHYDGPMNGTEMLVIETLDGTKNCYAEIFRGLAGHNGSDGAAGPPGPAGPPGTGLSTNRLCYVVNDGVIAQTIAKEILFKLTTAYSRVINDPSGWWSPTNYRLTPSAGVHYLTVRFSNTGSTSGAFTSLIIYKNGLEYARTESQSVGINRVLRVTANNIILANGTDYFEIYVYHSGNQSQISALGADMQYINCIKLGVL